MTYFIYLDNGYVSDAKTEDEAMEDARDYFIEILQRNTDVVFQVEEEG
jgi:hypothetical protein